MSETQSALLAKSTYGDMPGEAHCLRLFVVECRNTCPGFRFTQSGLRLLDACSTAVVQAVRPPLGTV
jgi:hypothetical protein